MGEDHMEQLQEAAREAIGAARGVLDALERLVDDDDRMASVLAGITDVVRLAADTAADLARPDGARPGRDRAASRTRHDEPGGGPVQHIVLS